MIDKSKVGLVILAAGKSTRMGVPKQLLQIQGTSMLKKIIETTLATSCFPIVVVLGANKELIKKDIEKIPVTVAENPKYDTGIASSIVMGLVASYMMTKDFDSIIFITSDQPQITSEHIKKLIDAAEKSDKQIIASKFTGGFGIPALFKKSQFDNILQLKGDSGAKKIMIDNKSEVEFIAFEDGHLDLDTIADYENYLSLN